MEHNAGNGLGNAETRTPARPSAARWIGRGLMVLVLALVATLCLALDSALLVLRQIPVVGWLVDRAIDLVQAL